MTKNYKIYVIGPSKGYGRWIEGNIINLNGEDNMEEADVVVLTGGEDISPVLYKESLKSVHTHVYSPNENGLSRRDQHEFDEYNKAFSLGKPVWGTCRGAQLLSAMAGGKLIQHIDHPGGHPLYFYDDKTVIMSNSLHHQMQYPYNLNEKEDYYILAHSHGLSRIHADGEGKQMVMPEKTDNGLIKEPEFIYYPKIKGLGIQGHPEMMDSNSAMVTTCRAFLNLLIEGHLDKVMKLNLPVKDVVTRAWNFRFTKEEKALLKSTATERVQAIV